MFRCHSKIMIRQRDLIFHVHEHGCLLACSGQPNSDFSFLNVTSAGPKIAASSSSDLIDARANFVDGCEARFEF